MVSLLLCLQAQNLLLPQVRAGRVKGFERSMPQVGGILGWHFPSWSSSGVKDWTVKVLRSGYEIPIHHLPPVAQEHAEFPSYGSVSAKAQALWEEMDKVL